MPLVARGEKVGAITFAWSQTRRHYSERDLPLMDDLATRAALAVDNARLYARERATGDQLAFLAEMSSVLASSLDYETTLANVAQLIVPQFADWCAVDIVARGRLDRAARRRPQGPGEERVGAPFARLASARSGRARGHGARRQDAASRCSTAGSRTSSSSDRARAGEPRGAARARHGLGDGRADEGARPHARRADARLVGSEAALRRRRADVRRAPRAAAPRSPVDNALLYRRSEQRAQAARALAFVADGVAARRRGRDRAHLERGGRGDHRPARSATSSDAPVDRGRSGLGRDRGARSGRRRPGHPARRDGAGRARARRALAVDLRRLAPGRHGLRVPRPHRGAARRAPEERVRLDDLARAPHAARGDLRRGADAPRARSRRCERSARACSTSSPPSPSGSRGSSTTSSG